MKKCPRCQKVLDLSEFGINKSKKDGLQSQCKPCRRTTNHEYYLKSPEQNENRKRSKGIQRNVNRDYVQSVLRESSCIDCGFSDVRALEFDHVRPGKTMHVSALVGGGYPLQRIIDEIALCEVRCANCHRIVTREREQASKALR